MTGNDKTDIYKIVRRSLIYKNLYINRNMKSTRPVLNTIVKRILRTKIENHQQLIAMLGYYL